MAPTNTFIDLTLDDDTQPRENSAQGSPVSGVIDLTGDLSSESESNILDPESSLPRFPNNASHSLSIQAEPSSSRSTPIETSLQLSTVLENPSGLPISPTKLSPPSTSGIRNEPTQTLPSQVERAQNISRNKNVIDEYSSEEEEEEEQEEDPGGRDTPSKRTSRGRPSSQKSFDQSVGTDSPLATRHKEKKSRLNNEYDGTRRGESPRAVMARRSLSMDQQSRAPQPNIVELEDSLYQSQQRVLDDHAETVRWLLHDAKRAVERTKSVFMDNVSPFASMQPVTALPGPEPEGMNTLKLDTFVSSAACLT